MLQRSLAPGGRFSSEALSPGVTLEGFHPGGKAGPNGETGFATPGGQVWAEIILLGGADQPFQMALPDIRLPANQLWPLHWHDCWTVVVIVEGRCLIGDWWMGKGDMFIAAPSIEYGPLVVGPDGCRLFEVFAQMHLSPGGYAPEYRDHPTLVGNPAVFRERSGLNARNAGRQSLPCDGVEGIWKGRLSPDTTWDLGAPNDPDRGLITSLRLARGEARPGRTYGDWAAILVLEGAVRLGERIAERDHFLLVRPGARLGELGGGEAGAELLELRRTAHA